MPYVGLWDKRIMQYQISPKTGRDASLPHSLFILNLLIVHLFASYTMLELGYGKQVVLIPFVSMIILGLLWLKSNQLRKTNIDWFTNAHWLLMTKRTRLLLIFYAVGLLLGGFTYLMVGMSPLKGNDVTTIALRMGAVPVFLGLLVTFVLSGGSIYDAQRGVIAQKIIDQFPPSDDMVVLHTDEEINRATTHAQGH
jgi:hypothetical protein